MRKNKLSDTHKGIMLIIISLLMIIIISVLYTKLKKEHEYDKETLCSIYMPYNSTVLIIDKSDKWSINDSNKIINVVENSNKNLKRGDRFIIKVIETDKNTTATIVSSYFDMCNPGKRGSANELYENPTKIQEIYNKRFKPKLDKILDKLKSPDVAKTTPLLETISDSLKDEKVKKSKKVNLIIISDLLEYSDEFNFYKKLPTIKSVVDEYDMPKNKLGYVKIKFIKRKGISKKRILKIFYKNLSNELNASRYKFNVLLH